MQLTQTIIQFPEIKLKTRNAHKLRGYFGNIFKEHLFSPYTLGLIIATIKYLKEEFNSQFFIMTATMPAKLLTMFTDENASFTSMYYQKTKGKTQGKRPISCFNMETIFNVFCSYFKAIFYYFCFDLNAIL